MTSPQIKVQLVDFMGSDLSVLDAARASFDRGGASYDDNGGLKTADISLLKFLARGYTQDEWDSLADKIYVAQSMADVKELMWGLRTKATHFAPFCHPQISIKVTAPLAVARQLWKSHVGAVGGDAGYAAWSEESRRYVDSEPEFYTPDTLRARADSVKQGSASTSVEDHEWLGIVMQQSNYRAGRDYLRLIDGGVAPELARLVLNTSMMVSWRWTGSLMFFARLCTLRLDGHAQKESQYVAEQISAIAKSLFPGSWEALMTGEITQRTKKLGVWGRFKRLLINTLITT